MPKEDLLDLEGTITDALGGGQYSVAVGDGEETTKVRAKLSGRLRKHHIRVLPGDFVTVSVSPYDLTHGIITYRGRAKRNREN